MKKLFPGSNFLFVLLIGLSTGACSDDKTENESEKLEITTAPLTIPWEGGPQQFEYRYSGAAGDVIPEAGDASWLHSFDKSESGTITFQADANTGAQREATITLSAPGVQAVTLAVTQEAIPDDFTFGIKDCTSSGATVEVIPRDINLYYTWDVVSRENFDRAYANDEALIEEHLAYLQQQFEEYRTTVDMNASLIDILCRNSDSQRITSLEPDTEYVVFAFGVNEHGESTTRPCKYIFRTGKFAVSDPCTFSITFPEVEQLQFTFTITPDDNTTRYYAGLTETETLDASSADQVAAQFIRQAEIAEIDWNAHDALYSGTITRNTYGDLGISDLEPDTEYSIVVFGVSPLGERTTEVSHESIRTASVPHSGMTFEFDVTETSLEGAVIDIIPSIKTETYMAGTIRKEIFDGFTDETSFMENLIGQGNIVLLEGDQTLDRTGKLLTDTEYICFAFGYIGGITTDLYKVEFLTREPETSGKAEVAIEFEYKTHATYDMAIYANLTPNKETAHWYAGAFNSVDGVIQVPFSGETLSDAEIIVSLTTNESAFYWDSPYAACGAYFGREYTFCVIACDDDGKFGPLVKKTVIAEESLLGEQ